MKKIITVIGFFGDGSGDCKGGQGIKTTILTEELERAYGKENVDRVNTNEWQKNPLQLFLNCAKAVRQSRNVFFLCADNGLKIFPPLLQAVNWERKCKIHYYVVGGFLQDYLKQNPKLIKSVKKIDCIYVELHSMKKALAEMGFTNVVYVNKFRRLNPINKDELDCKLSSIIKLCFFARVMREKGIEEIVQVVNSINESQPSPVVSLDIFGEVDPGYISDFEKLQSTFPDQIRYKGIVDFRESQGVLATYNALVFPTFYHGEGYPNTIVDAFAAGLPVLASRWHYNSEIIQDYHDGLIFDTHDLNQMKEAIMFIKDNPEKYSQMRLNCLARCEEYSPENALKIVMEHVKK